MTGKIVISEAMDAYRVAKEYVSGLYLSPELVMNVNQPKYCLANFYRTPNYRNKAGGVCFVFEYRSAASSAPEYYRIYVKCFSAKPKYRVRSIEIANSSLEEILPGDNFSSLGGRYHYDGNKIIPLELTPDVAP